MSEEEARLPVHLWIDAQLRPLNDNGIFYYIHKSGDKNTGIILLKINRLDGFCKLLIQQRDFEGKMGWMTALQEEIIEESIADTYIKRSSLRDPDLWVIEIEDRNMNNPFEGDVIKF